MSLVDSSSQVQTAYEPTLWAKVFHSVPHVNITFQPVDSRFNPENDLYLESLGILASLPAAWLITTLVILLIYLLTRCCDTKNNKKRKSRPIRCCLSFFALTTMTTLSLGFWGNHVLHGGLREFEKATDKINNIIAQSQELSEKFNTEIENGIKNNLSPLYDGPFSRPITENEMAYKAMMNNADFIFFNVSEGQAAMDTIRFALNKQNAPIDFRHVTNTARSIELYRWPTTMVLQSLFTMFCLLLFVGAIIHSRCVLILFSVLGLFSIILLWLLSSVYITVAVAFADLCYDPTPWIMHIIEDRVPRDMSTYYLQCTNSRANPFDRSISLSERAVVDIGKKVRQISSTARTYYSPTDISEEMDNLVESSERLTQFMNDLIVSLKCDQIFRSYNTALVSVCDSGLLGVILMLISAAISGLFFTILVWCNSHTWIYFKHKGRYIKVDDQDPYMPLSTIERSRSAAGGGLPPPSSVGGYRRTIHTPPQTPPYHGTLNGHNGHSNTYSHSAYGQIGITPGSHGAAAHNHHHHNTLGGPTSHLTGTLGRNTSHHSSHHRGMEGGSSTMTLGRRGHYASLRNHSRLAVGGDGGESVPVGPNMGQYATLSKQCKTLESSDFY